MRKRETDKSYLPLSLCEDLSEAQQSSGAAADLKPADPKWPGVCISLGPYRGCVCSGRPSGGCQDMCARLKQLTMGG